MKQARLTWADGQPISREFDDVYFSREGGVAETDYVFLQHNDLPRRWQGRSRFVIGETGFGTGLNFLTTLQHWLATSRDDARLYYYSVEKYPLSPTDLARALEPWEQFSDSTNALLEVYPPPVSGLHRRELFDGRVCLCLLFDDVLTGLEQLDVEVDSWYLDGFAPGKNPDMWRDAVFAQIARLSHGDTRLSTYTAAGFVRRGLAARGFDMRKVPGFGHKRAMLAGRMSEPQSRGDDRPWFRVPEFRPATRSVAVIGAGIAGVSSARALAARGWQVTLVDARDTIAGAASGNPRGVVLPRLSRQRSAESDFDRAAFLYTVYRLNRLQQSDGRIGWCPSGVAQLPSSARIQGHMHDGEFEPALAQCIDEHQLAAYSGLPVPGRALWYPLAGYVNPPALCRALVDEAGDSVQFMNSTPVARIDYEQGQWSLLGEAGDVLLSCHAVVIASGHRLDRFRQTDWLPVTPVRGQISVMSATPMSEGLRCPLCYEGYVLPAESGRHVLGASFQPGDEDPRLRREDHQQNLSAVAQWLPDLFAGQQPLGGRAAIRAGTPDRLPLLGPVADRDFYHARYADLSRGKPGGGYPAAEYLPGLYVNVGHGARGLTSALLCAEILAAQMNNEPAPVYTSVQQALHPARFMIRQLKKGKTVST